jgi:hypothetical protein
MFRAGIARSVRPMGDRCRFPGIAGGAVPEAPGVGMTRHPMPGAAEQSSVAVWNHQEISDLRNFRRFRAPEQRSPLSC